MAASPAEAAGFKPGDVITGLNGAPMVEPAQLAGALKFFPPGMELHFRVARGAEALELALVVGTLDLRASARVALARAADSLVARQLAGGAWPDFQHVEPTASAPCTALALAALATASRVPGVATPEAWSGAAARAVAFLAGCQVDDGSVRDPGEAVGFRNYATALTATALARLDPEAHADALGRCRDYLVARQLTGEFGYTEYHWQHGAWDYYDENKEGMLRADISVTSSVLEGLRSAGLRAEAPTWGRALKFLRQAQNLSPRASDPEPLRDGGFPFSPRESKAGMVRLGGGAIGFRSYGSATADGLRGLLYCGLPADHPAVRSALGWIGAHYGVDVNPGFDDGARVPYDRGIRYYYLASLAKALHAAGVRQLETPEGPRSWPEDVLDYLLHRQAEDGSFASESNVMHEDDPVLSTSFALEAMARAVASME